MLFPLPVHFSQLRASQYLVHLLLSQPVRAASHDGVNADPPVKRSGGQDGRVSGAPLDVKAPLRVGRQLIQHLGNKTKSSRSELLANTMSSSISLFSRCSSCSPAASTLPYTLTVGRIRDYHTPLLYFLLPLNFLFNSHVTS